MKKERMCFTKDELKLISSALDVTIDYLTAGHTTMYGDKLAKKMKGLKRRIDSFIIDSLIAGSSE